MLPADPRLDVVSGKDSDGVIEFLFGGFGHTGEIAGLAESFVFFFGNTVKREQVDPDRFGGRTGEAGDKLGGFFDIFIIAVDAVNEGYADIDRGIGLGECPEVFE